MFARDGPQVDMVINILIIYFNPTNTHAHTQHAEGEKVPFLADV